LLVELEDAGISVIQFLSTARPETTDGRQFVTPGTMGHRMRPKTSTKLSFGALTNADWRAVAVFIGVVYGVLM